MNTIPDAYDHVIQLLEDTANGAQNALGESAPTAPVTGVLP